MSVDFEDCQDGDTAVVCVPDTKDAEPRQQPPYAVIIENDDLHTVEYVVELIMKIFHYDTAKAFGMAKTIDASGRCIVWSGSKEVAELKVEQIRGYGPDFFAAEKVEFPLGCYIEPLPG